METVEDLRDWLDAEKWREEYASSVFRTPASWTWFKRRHLRRLVEEGVLIPGVGRGSDSVHTGKIAGVVQKIRQAESLGRLQAAMV